jgi:protein SCO1/2
VKYKKDTRGMFEHSNLITVLNAEGEIVHQRAGLEDGQAQAARAVVTSR